MNIRKTALPSLLALLWVGCTTSSGFDPVEVDLSAKKTPLPAATAAPASTTRAASIAVPTPVATPVEPGAPAAVTSTPSPAPPGPVQAPSTSPVSPEALIRSRIEGYNRRDTELLMRLYSPDARIYDPPERLRDSGQARIRQAYIRRFAAAPESRLEADDVRSQGSYVVSRETESTGAGQGSSVLVISEVRDQRIVREWILR